MNFATDLPKSSPVVSYIVASALRSSKVVPGKSKETPCFRMHAVILKDKGKTTTNDIESRKELNEGKGYILCHIRKVNELEAEPSPEVKMNQEEILAKENYCENLIRTGQSKVASIDKGLSLFKGDLMDMEVDDVKLNIKTNRNACGACDTCERWLKEDAIRTEKQMSCLFSSKFYNSSKSLMTTIRKYKKFSYTKLYKIISEV